MQARLAASRARARATLVRTRQIIQRVIAGNRRLREFPGHDVTAERRIAEGHAELERVDEETTAIDTQDDPPSD